MVVATHVSEIRTVIAEWRAQGRRIGFVPTMGALHDGHLSLVRLARQNSDAVVVSIFVNPLQFGPDEDYLRYPRALEKDTKLLDNESVDVVLAPSPAEMYSQQAQITVIPGPVADTFEGKTRPGHFGGVLTIVAKLFNIVQPHVAVLGQKDVQQLFLVKRMVRELNFPVEVIAGETIREPDGLALSSRNVYLKASERQEASVLHRALLAGAEAYSSGKTALSEVRAAMLQTVEAVPRFSLDYATAVTEEAFVEQNPVPPSAFLVIAGRLGSVRLIDNLSLPAECTKRN